MKPIEMDLHCFDLRFRETRIQRESACRKLLQSMASQGQQSPVWAVQSEEKWVLIDGYLRFEVMQRLGKDTLLMVHSEHPVKEAALAYLRAQHTHPIEPIEEAWIIADLLAEDTSQAEVAKQLGRDKSWVCRRLSLIQDLPETVQQAIRTGQLSTWSATRIMKPLARANTDHAEQLLTLLQQTPLSTRQLDTWYGYYQTANQGQREKMVQQPALFLQSLTESTFTEQAKQLKEGPEGEWLTGIQRVVRGLRQLRRQEKTLFTPLTQSPQQMAPLIQAFDSLEHQFYALQKQIKERQHAQRTHPGSHTSASPKQHAHSQDQPVTESVPQHSPSGAEGKDDCASIRCREVGRHHLDLARSLLQHTGECSSDSGTSAGTRD